MARTIKTIDYDIDNDIFFVSDGEKVKSSIDIGDFVLDVDHRNLICGIEIMDASENLGIDKEILKNVETLEIFISNKSRKDAKVLVNGKKLDCVQKIEIELNNIVKIALPKITVEDKIEYDWVNIEGLLT